ncbi:hypothetical protein P4O66_017759 [Electrophorus voltai]|uniref:Uncharacterized protein n=1 Tax=Electrophorus voltai TaxID=2609070 RepID=A0AAD8YSH2_9TELE|nr:hypothetical protein P4O66_017759 [Electrophorus voltai]
MQQDNDWQSYEERAEQNPHDDYWEPGLLAHEHHETLLPALGLQFHNTVHRLIQVLVLQPTTTSLPHDKMAMALRSHPPVISFGADSTLECTLKRSPEELELKLGSMARLRSKKSSL